MEQNFRLLSTVMQSNTELKISTNGCRAQNRTSKLQSSCQLRGKD